SVPITETLTNTGNDSARVIYTITPWTVDAGGSLRCPGIPIDVDIWVEPIPEVTLKRQEVGGEGSNSIFCSGLTTNIQTNSITEPTYGVRFRYTIVPDSPPDINFVYSADTFDLQKQDSIVDVITNLSSDVQGITIEVTPYLIDPSGNPKCEGITRTMNYEITPPLIMRDSAKSYIFDTLNLRCFKDNSGVIYFNSAGGISAYAAYDFYDLEYSFQGNPLLSGERDSMNNLAAGDYLIEVNDWSGCNEDTTITLNQPDSLWSHFEQIEDVICNGEIGVFEIVPEGGTRYYDAIDDTSYGYEVTWDDVGTYPFMPPYPNPLPYVSTGFYSWHIYDSNGCYTDGAYQVIGENAQIQEFEAEPTYGEGAFETGISCYGADDGQLYTRVQSSGLNLDYYLYNEADVLLSSGSSFQQTYYYNDVILGPGLYYELVVTPSGCVDTAYYELTEPEPIRIDDTLYSIYNDYYNVSCFYSSDGSIALYGVNGSHSNYEYLWQNEGVTMPGETSNSIHDVTAGNYRVLITSDDLCTDTFEFELVTPSEIILSANVTNIDCYGDASGVIVLNSSGGIGPHEYSWETPGLSGSQASGLVADTYIYSVEDSLGCVVTDTTVLTQRPPITVQPDISDYNGFEIRCDDGSDGWISVLSEGGTGDHTYSWDFEGIGVPGDTNKITGLQEGTYNLQITDANACVFDTSYTLAAPSRIRITTTSHPKVCSTLGWIETNSVRGGIPFPEDLYQLQWSNGSNEYVVNDLSDGTYYVTVTDFNSCSVVDSAIVELESSMEIKIQIRDSIQCQGYSNGVLGVDLLYETYPLQVFWNGQPGDTLLNDVSTGEYTLMITDDNECISYDSIQVTEPGPIEPVIDVYDARCFDSTDAVVEFSATGSNGGFSYFWNDSLVQGPWIENQKAGEYQLSFVDRKGCSKIEIVIIEQPDKIEILTYDDDIFHPYCAYSDNGRIKVTVIGGIPPYNYEWLDQDVYTDTISNLGVGEYIILVTDNHGCTMQRVITLEPLLAACLDIPSAFTPNNDGYNETWVILDPSDESIPVSQTYPDLIIEVFDRNGRKVWTSSRGYTEPWDGKDKYGRLLPVDTYYYFIHLNNGTGVIIQNIITIIQ
ncbi:MAG: gliding motility-associated C-terminal domain-containing protein, partial [Bacteroidales bacterium]|nr:gliding motility-associated C-terminal domain-containing protein [Bacteroidales bacterium]